jgi:hypothetical protein
MALSLQAAGSWVENSPHTINRFLLECGSGLFLSFFFVFPETAKVRQDLLWAVEWTRVALMH